MLVIIMYIISMTAVGFEPIRMRRRRLVLQSTAPLPTALTLTKALGQKKIDFFL